MLLLLLQERAALERLIRDKARGGHHAAFRAYLHQKQEQLERALQVGCQRRVQVVSGSSRLLGAAGLRHLPLGADQRCSARPRLLGWLLLLPLQEPLGEEAAATSVHTNAASQQPPEVEAADPGAACRGGCTADDVLGAVDEGDCESPFDEGPDVGGGGGGGASGSDAE